MFARKLKNRENRDSTLIFVWYTCVSERMCAVRLLYTSVLLRILLEFSFRHSLLLKQKKKSGFFSLNSMSVWQHSISWERQTKMDDDDDSKK